MPRSLRLIVKRQDAICVFHRTIDSGEFVAVCCARGFMEALGRKVEKGEIVEIQVRLREIPRT
jgi:hypothetical protein